MNIWIDIGLVGVVIAGIAALISEWPRIAEVLDELEERETARIKKQIEEVPGE